MRLELNSVAGALALVMSSAVAAQAAPPAKSATKATPATPAEPNKVQTTTTPPITPVPDEATTGQTTAPGQTGTTPGQEQTTPGQASQLTPAVTGTTPSGQTTGQAASTQITAATAADVKPGVSIYDQNGGLVGKVESVSGKNAVVSTGSVKASIPISSFAKGDKGLVMSMTKAQLDASAKQKTAATTKPAKKPK